MSLSVEVFSSLEEVDWRDWDKVRAFCPNKLFMKREFLLAVEAAFPMSKFWYVIVYQGEGEAVASACLSLFRYEHKIRANKHQREQKAEKIKRAVYSLMDTTILFCGLPVSTGKSHLCISPNVDSDLVTGALDQVVSTIANKNRAKLTVYPVVA